MSTTASISPAAPFAVPNDGPTYIEQVLSRSHDLIQCGIWAGLHISQLNQWWSNFRTDTEKYFAACLLDSIVYRSDEQTIALMRQLIQRALPDLGRASGGVDDWEDRLSASLCDSRVRLVPVIPPGTAQAKSGYVILRLFEKRLSVPAHLFARPEDLASLVGGGLDAIVFIDDLLGTGTQFVTEFAAPYDLRKLGASMRLIYAPLVAHKIGIEHIGTHLPEVAVTSAELLGDSHAIFGPGGRTFADGLNSPEAAWKVYSDILSSRAIHLDPSANRGFGELELAFFFQHAAPDNCLPIFWWKHSTSWKPLFFR